MTFIKSTVAAAIISAMSLNAHAATVNFGNVTDNFGFGFSSNGSGTFSDTLTFSLTEDKMVEAVLFSFSFSSMTISDFWATLSEDGYGVIATMPITSNFESGMAVAMAGDYTLTLSGDYGTYGTYDIDAVLSPVPEPSTLGLMFGGIGLIGILAARSRIA